MAIAVLASIPLITAGRLILAYAQERHLFSVWDART
jgi:hypothetical protein